MKKKLIITCSLITILLAGFPHVLYAEDVPQSYEGGYTTHYGNISELDDYFYENFVLLPYLESDNNQYINTGVNGKSSLSTRIVFSGLNTSRNSYFFGSSVSGSYYNSMYSLSNEGVLFTYGSAQNTYNYNLNSNLIYDIYLDENKAYLNDDLVMTLTASNFTNNYPIYIFANNNNGSPANFSSCKIYYFSIYDNEQVNDEDIGLLRSFYPARQKSNGSYGLYDAVNKIFYVSNSGTPFENPEGSDVELSLLSRIGLWLRTSLGSISEIFAYIVTEPIILFFMAVGLAGAMYRWARRLVHF